VTTLVYVDVELAVRTWARTHPVLTALVGARTFFALPDKYRPSAKGPAVTVNMIGGSPDPTSPLNLPELQFDCWGTTKAEAAAVHLGLLEALHSLTRTTVTTTAGDVILADARVTGVLFSPDTSADPVLPRYVVTALVAALPA
jgi:hypothetical protein